MNTVIELLEKHPAVSGYKINLCKKESYELFFVKGKLETVRCTDTCDKEVTVYVEHGDYMGDSQFFVYPSATDEQLCELIDEAVERAMLINNQKYALPEKEEGEYEVESNFKDYELADLAELVSKAVFEANTVEQAALNSVEIFINRLTETVRNSRGLCKTQHRYRAMVEAIPTYNGEKQSVELYEQHNFSCFNGEDISREISEKLKEVKARYEAVKPDFPLEGNVIFNKLELSELFFYIADDLNYASVYSKSNLFHKEDLIQKAPVGDRISIRMAGEEKGNIGSAKFDQDGMSLGSIQLVEAGKAVNYYGSNRYGQYLGEKPTGNLKCLCVEPGTADAAAFENSPCLEVISMSGVQVDFYHDYIGGEVRLAYYNDGSRRIPVTGVSVSGQLSEVLNHIRMSEKTAVHNSYMGPEKAILSHMKIF